MYYKAAALLQLIDRLNNKRHRMLYMQSWFDHLGRIDEIDV